MNKILLFITLLLYLSSITIRNQAQIISYPTPAQPITRGLDSTLLTVKIDFPACTSPTVTVNLGSTNSPGLIQYIPGSITKTGGTASLNISESNISDLSKPVFSVSGNPTAGQFLEFTIKRRANCGNAASSKDAIFVTGGCSFSETDPNTNTYNLFSPALTIIPPTLLSNVNLGQSYNRTFTISNGGLGALDTFGLWIKYPAGTAVLNSLKVGAQTLTPAFSNGDSSYFIIKGTVFGPDKLFSNGESITFTENVKYIACTPSNVTIYGNEWRDHLGNICEFGTAPGNYTQSSNAPNIVSSVPNPNYNMCFRGDTIKQVLRINNNGLGTANNIDFFFSSDYYGNPYASLSFDTSRAWVIRNELGDSIGRVANFYNTDSAIGAIYFNICTPPTTNGRIGEGWARIPSNINIPPGGYIDVEVYQRGKEMDCSNQICRDGMGWISLLTIVDYKNQCGTASYREPFKFQFQRAFNYFGYSKELPTDINPGPFNLDLTFSYFANIQHPDGSGLTYLCIKLPPNITPGASSVNFDTYTFPMSTTSPFSSSTDTLWIGPIPQNIPYKIGLMTIPLVAACGTPGTKNLEIFFLSKYSTCAPIVKVACQNISTNLHCGLVCPKGGATPLNFKLARINFGLPDNNEDHIPDASGSLNMALVKDHRSVNGDTLKGTWNIKVYPNTDPTDPNNGNLFTYVYTDFYLGDNAPNGWGILEALPNAIVKVYNSTGSLINTCTISPTIVGGGKWAHYELSAASCRGGATWASNDSIVIEALYKVVSLNSQNFERVNYFGKDLFITNNYVYSTYTQKTTQQIAPIDGETYTCDRFNDYNEISRIWLSNFIPIYQQIDGCTNTLSSTMRQYTREQELDLVFPYEYRNFSVFDTMTITLPPGFVYRPGSSKLSNFVGFSFQPPISINDADVFQVGNKLKINLKKYYTPYGGVLVPGDVLAQCYVEFSLDPTCDAAPGVYESGTSTSMIGNGTNTPLNDWYQLTHVNLNIPNGWVYNAPQPLLSGGGSVLSSNKQATWSINLQNLSNAITAPNSWFYISPKNGLTDIKVFKGAVEIVPDANGFYQLGTLNAAVTDNYFISAETSLCVDDSMRLNFGWGCSGYPSSFNLQSCTQTKWLKISNYQSQIQLSVIKQPATSPGKPLCESDTVIFMINSAQAAYADNPEFLVSVPTGLNIIKGEIEYPEGSDNWETITPTASFGILTYKVESHSQLQALHGTLGLPGTLDNPGPNERKAQLRLIYTTDCNFTSGTKLTVRQRADRPCGVPIPVSLGYNALVRTDPINVTGVPNAGNVSFDLAMTPSTIKCTGTQMSATATPVGAPVGSGDTIIINIPQGLNYTPGSFSGSSSISLISVTTLPNGSTILRLKPLTGAPIGVPISYSIGLVPNSTGCGNYLVSSEAIRTIPPLSCATVAGGLCPNNSASVVGSGSVNLNVDRAQLDVVGIQLLSGVFAPGTSNQFAVQVQNSSPTQAANVGSLRLDFYCGTTGNTPVASQTFPQTVPPNSLVTATMTVFLPPMPDCMNGQMLRVIARPQQDSCLCNIDTFVWTGSLLSADVMRFTATRFENRKSLLQFNVSNSQADGTVFMIERRFRYGGYYSIGSIRAGAVSNYKFIDETPNLSQKNYYRIKIIRPDGSIKISEERMVEFILTDEAFTIYPNPTRDILNINIKLGVGKYKGIIYTAEGNQVNRYDNLRSGFNRINLEGLSKGVYLLKIYEGDLYIGYDKVIIQ